MQHVFSRGFLVSAPSTIIMNLPDRAGSTRRSMRFPDSHSSNAPCASLDLLKPFLCNLSITFTECSVLVKVIYSGAVP